PRSSLSLPRPRRGRPGPAHARVAASGEGHPPEGLPRPDPAVDPEPRQDGLRRPADRVAARRPPADAGGGDGVAAEAGPARRRGDPPADLGAPLRGGRSSRSPLAASGARTLA